MAKAKKVKPVIEQPEVQTEQELAVIETPEILEVETVEEIVDEKKTESPLLSTPVSGIELKPPLHIEPVMATEYKERIELTADLTKEEKLLKFIENSSGNMVKLNDFLKSLYPALAPMEPPVWKQQITNRQIKLMLMKMENDGLIKIVNNLHSELGNPYFKGEEQRAAHYDLDSITIAVEK